MSDICPPSTAVLRTTVVNKTRNCVIGDSDLPVGDIFCAVAEGDRVLIPKKKLFDNLSREWGRCASKVYVGDGIQVGWSFESRQPYEDDPSQTYIREVWVSFVLEETTVTHLAI